jgi:DNA-binding transcriptional LysR family regulator
MELQQARYVLAVAKTLNFTRAAEHCQVTQPALTRAIQRLETELGGDLIHRERQHTQLTDLGKLVLPKLQSMIAAADAARVHAQDFRSKAIAPLKIGLTPCVSAKLVARPLFEITRLMPGLRVDMIERPIERLLQMLLNGEINVAVAGDAGALPERIDHWKLFEEQLLVLLGAHDRRVAQPSISRETMESITWLERVGCEILEKSWPKISSLQKQPRIAHRGQHESHLQQMVAAGLGAMLIAEHAPYPPSLAAIPIEGKPLRRDVQLLAVAGRQYSPALDALIKVARVLDWQAEIDISAKDPPV